MAISTYEKVQFLTTGAGRVRFNPNLYESGKVCLSLLGTWAGPGWIPNKSTLIQILVSIQSLILVEQPYFNEPSFETTMGTPQGTKQSNAYNREIRRATVNHGMLGILRSPPPFFEEVVAQHFAHVGSSLVDVVGGWATDEKAIGKGEKDIMARGLTSKSAVLGGKQIAELKKLIGKLPPV